MNYLLNVSNHNLTKEQIEELNKRGYQVIEMQEKDKLAWGQLNPSNYKEIADRILKNYGVEAYHVAGFAPAVAYFVSKADFCFYAYSERKSIEKEVNGVITKTSIFEHKGFFMYEK